MKHQKIYAVIITIFLIFTICSLHSFAENDTNEIQTKAILKISGIEAENASVEIAIQNTETKETYNVQFRDADNWTNTIPTPEGTYEVKSIKVLKGNFNASINKSRGTIFTINSVEFTEIHITVKQLIKTPTALDFLKNNIIILALIAGSGVGLLVIKNKRQKGEA